jgi:DNA topoisomerase III
LCRLISRSEGGGCVSDRRAKPNSEYGRLYAAAVARRQADQIYNLSLTRTATVILGRGARRVIGVGRVKTPTLAIVCRRELEIRNFVPITYFEVVATAKVAGGQFQMRHAPQQRIVRREVAQEVVSAAGDFEGALTVRVEDKRQGPPKLHDLPSLQKLCGSRFGWPASKTLEVAQELYDGQGKKIITYPRAEVRYLPQSLISDVPRIVAGLRAGQSFGAIPIPEPPVIRKGASGTFYDKGLEVRAIMLSFPTSIRSTNCGRFGLVCRPMGKKCSTSSRGPIWPP